MSEDVPEQIVIRYDGLEAASHRMEIGALADSLKGMGRIIGVAGTFAATERLVLHADARPLRVLVGPPEPNCVTFHAGFEWVQANPLITTISGGLATSLVVYIFKYFGGQSEEMKHLRAVTEEAIRVAGHRDELVVQRMLDTIDKMAERLAPAVRQAVEPIGSAAATMTVGNASGSNRIVVDQAMRDAIRSESPIQVGTEVVLEVRFLEMNLDAHTCRISVGDEEEDRFPADITDPVFMLPGNPYAVAFAQRASLSVVAKPTLRNGNIDRWYISDFRS